MHSSFLQCNIKSIVWYQVAALRLQKKQTRSEVRCHVVTQIAESLNLIVLDECIKYLLHIDFYKRLCMFSLENCGAFVAVIG